ncbi:MAG: hypothetical protein ABIP85_01165 [Chthoniobacteraceae bacterium]
MKMTPSPPDRIPLPFIRGFALPALAIALLLFGCTSPAPQHSVGNAPRKMSRAEQWKAAGWLQVFSEQAWGRKAEGGPTSFVYSEYKVLTPGGKFVMQVENGGPMEGPSVVRMDPGSYVVVAQAYKRGTVRVPVSIETGTTSVLHLDQANHADIPRP